MYGSEAASYTSSSSQAHPSFANDTPNACEPYNDLHKKPVTQNLDIDAECRSFGSANSASYS